MSSDRNKSSAEGKPNPATPSGIEIPLVATRAMHNGAGEEQPGGARSDNADLRAHGSASLRPAILPLAAVPQ